MKKIKDYLKEILIFKYSENKKLYFEKTLITEYEWDNNLNKYHFAVLNNKNREERIKEYIKERIINIEEELSKIKDIYLEVGFIKKFLIEKNKFKLISINDIEAKKRIKKFVVRKRYLEKRLNYFKNIESDFEIEIVKNNNLNKDYQIYMRGEKIDKDLILDKYYVSKIANSDNQFKIYFLIEHKDVIPRRVIDINENKVYITLSIDRHIGSEEYSDLIDLNKIMSDGTVIGSKLVAFKEKAMLIDFLNKIRKNVNDSYNSAIRSL